MNVVDSSAWIEYVNDGPNAAEFAAAIESTGELIVPSVAIYEVFECVARTLGETSALDLVGVMLQGEVVELSASLALESARISSDVGLSMADSVMLATARAHDAVLWTQDAHFEGLSGVEYRRAEREG